MSLASDAHNTIVIRLGLARALWYVPKERPRAHRLAKESLAAAESAGDKPAIEQARRWLAEHRLTARRPRARR